MRSHNEILACVACPRLLRLASSIRVVLDITRVAHAREAAFCVIAHGVGAAVVGVGRALVDVGVGRCDGGRTLADPATLLMAVPLCDDTAVMHGRVGGIEAADLMPVLVLLEEETRGASAAAVEGVGLL